MSRVLCPTSALNNHPVGENEHFRPRPRRQTADTSIDMSRLGNAECAQKDRSQARGIVQRAVITALICVFPVTGFCGDAKSAVSLVGRGDVVGAALEDSVGKGVCAVATADVTIPLALVERSEYIVVAHIADAAE
jgi:hypothetical protein